MTELFSTTRRYDALTKALIAAEIDECAPARKRTLQERDAARATKAVGEILASARRQRERAELAKRKPVTPIVTAPAITTEPTIDRQAIMERHEREYGSTGMSVSNPSRNTMPSTPTMRVWQIAHDIGRTSAETVTLLREYGEYVRSAQSTVVTFAAERFMAATGRHAWTEKRLSDCEHGCKVYSNGIAEQVMHSTVYGCSA